MLMAVALPSIAAGTDSNRQTVKDVGKRANNINIEAKKKGYKHTKATIDHGCYDFIVSDDGTVKDALLKANSRNDDSRRFRIFIRPGQHQMPATPDKTSRGSDGIDYPSPNNYVEWCEAAHVQGRRQNNNSRNTWSKRHGLRVS